jgi:peptide/nickel transport system permease protein
MEAPLESAAPPEAEGGAGAGPWRLAWRRLRRNQAAIASLIALVVIVIACLLAPFYANSIAHTDPFQSNVSGTTIVNGKRVPVMQQTTSGLGLGVIPIGPTWDPHHYLLGADQQGRDVMARLLYGGRNSLLIGGSAALLTCLMAAITALAAGFFGGWVDGVLSRVMDVVWALPYLLLGLCLSVVFLASGGFKWGPISISASSLVLPIGIISIVFVPYVFRPIRGQVLSLREKEYVQAAIGLGASDWRLLTREVLPNIVTTLIVLFPIMMAISMLTEAALSFLGIGVQPPNCSWGTIINDGVDLLYTRPWVAIAPGIAITVTVLTLNVLGDGVRDALDPRAKLRGSD